MNNQILSIELLEDVVEPTLLVEEAKSLSNQARIRSADLVPDFSPSQDLMEAEHGLKKAKDHLKKLARSSGRTSAEGEELHQKDLQEARRIIKEKQDSQIFVF